MPPAARCHPGATHLFPEPGALEEVARRAKDWFVQYLIDPKIDEAILVRQSRAMPPDHRFAQRGHRLHVLLQELSWPAT